MAVLTGSLATIGSVLQPGPFLDDGASYSAIGPVKLNLQIDHTGLSPNPQLDGISPALEGIHIGNMERVDMPIPHIVF